MRSNGQQYQGNSSGYSSSSNNSGGDSFEARFQSKFRTPQFLPPPEPFSGGAKTYPSKVAQQQQQQQNRTLTLRQIDYD